MPATTGVLVVNLGTPDAPTPEAVRRFLAEFLSDPRVVNLPRLPWQLVLRAFVLPFRPRRSARAYQQVWTARRLAAPDRHRGADARARKPAQGAASGAPGGGDGHDLWQPFHRPRARAAARLGRAAPGRAAAVPAVLRDDQRGRARPRRRRTCRAGVAARPARDRGLPRRSGARRSAGSEHRARRARHSTTCCSLSTGSRCATPPPAILTASSASQLHASSPRASGSPRSAGRSPSSRASGARAGSNRTRRIACASSRRRASAVSRSPARASRWIASRRSRRSRSGAAPPSSPPAAPTSSTSRRSMTTRRRWTAWRVS